MTEMLVMIIMCVAGINLTLTLVKDKEALSAGVTIYWICVFLYWICKAKDVTGG